MVNPKFKDKSLKYSMEQVDYLEKNNLFIVEDIIDEKQIKGQSYFKVRWQGYSPNEDSWEPAVNLQNVKHLIDNFHRKFLKFKLSDHKNLKRTYSQSSLNTDEASDSSGSLTKICCRAKQKRFEYVPQNELVASKTKYFDDIRDGKIDLTGNDLYSRVKTRRRYNADGSQNEQNGDQHGSMHGDSENEQVVEMAVYNSAPSSPKHLYNVENGSENMIKENPCDFTVGKTCESPDVSVSPIEKVSNSVKPKRAYNRKKSKWSVKAKKRAKRTDYTLPLDSKSTTSEMTEGTTAYKLEDTSQDSLNSPGLSITSSELGNSYASTSTSVAPLHVGVSRVLDMRPSTCPVSTQTNSIDEPNASVCVQTLPIDKWQPEETKLTHTAVVSYEKPQREINRPTCHNFHHLALLYMAMVQGVSPPDKEDGRVPDLSRLPCYSDFDSCSEVSGMNHLDSLLSSGNWSALSNLSDDALERLCDKFSIGKLLLATVCTGEDKAIRFLARLLDVLNRKPPGLPSVIDETSPENGLTCLHVACAMDRVQAAQMLMDVGARINQPERFTGNDRTPLSLAIRAGNVDLVAMLVLNGANFYCVEKNTTALLLVQRLLEAHACRTDSVGGNACNSFGGSSGGLCVPDEVALRQASLAAHDSGEDAWPSPPPGSELPPLAPSNVLLNATLKSFQHSNKNELDANNANYVLPPVSQLQRLHTLLSTYHTRLSMKLQSSLQNWLTTHSLSLVATVTSCQWVSLRDSVAHTHLVWPITGSTTSTALPSVSSPMSSSMPLLFLVHGRVLGHGTFHVWLDESGPCFIHSVTMDGQRQVGLCDSPFVVTLVSSAFHSGAGPSVSDKISSQVNLSSLSKPVDQQKPSCRYEIEVKFKSLADVGEVSMKSSYCVALIVLAVRLSDQKNKLKG